MGSARAQASVELIALMALVALLLVGVGAAAGWGAGGIADAVRHVLGDRPAALDRARLVATVEGRAGAPGLLATRELARLHDAQDGDRRLRETIAADLVGRLGPVLAAIATRTRRGPLRERPVQIELTGVESLAVVEPDEEVSLGAERHRGGAAAALAELVRTLGLERVGRGAGRMVDDERVDALVGTAELAGAIWDLERDGPLVPAPGRRAGDVVACVAYRSRGQAVRGAVRAVVRQGRLIQAHAADRC